MPTLASWPGVAGAGCLHFGHNTRTRRWPTTAVTAEAVECASTPISLQADEHARRLPGVHGGDDQVTGHARLHRDARGVEVADLPDHDDVRVLAQHRAQALGEGEALGLLDLRLVDVGEVELDGVFQGVDRGAVRAVLQDVAQRRVDGGGLARSRRPVEDDHPLRPMDDRLEQRQLLGREAEGLQAVALFAAVEDAHDDALAVHGGHEGHAQVHVAIRRRPARTGRPGDGRGRR